MLQPGSEAILSLRHRSRKLNREYSRGSANSKSEKQYIEKAARNSSYNSTPAYRKRSKDAYRTARISSTSSSPVNYRVGRAYGKISLSASLDRSRKMMERKQKSNRRVQLVSGSASLRRKQRRVERELEVRFPPTPSVGRQQSRSKDVSRSALSQARNRSFNVSARRGADHSHSRLRNVVYHSKPRSNNSVTIQQQSR